MIWFASISRGVTFKSCAEPAAETMRTLIKPETFTYVVALHPILLASAIPTWQAGEKLSQLDLGLDALIAIQGSGIHTFVPPYLYSYTPGPMIAILVYKTRHYKTCRSG